jgi:hypothetical protein
MAQEFVALKACLEVSFKHSSLKGEKSGEDVGAWSVPDNALGASLLAKAVHQAKFPSAATPLSRAGLLPQGVALFRLNPHSSPYG